MHSVWCVWGRGGFKKIGKSQTFFSRNIAVNYSEVREEEGERRKEIRVRDRGSWEEGGRERVKSSCFIFILSFHRHLGLVILSEKIGIVFMFSV
jgi:hypothetical protein